MTPAHPSRSLHDQAGLIGKVAVFWIIAALLAALLILDALSIVLTTFRLSSTAQGAASTAATTYKNSHNTADACEAAGVELLRDNTPVPESEGWCKINTTTGIGRRSRCTRSRRAWSWVVSPSPRTTRRSPSRRPPSRRRCSVPS